MLPTIHWHSVIVSAVAVFAIGALWYSPILFGKAWVNLPADRHLRGATLAFLDGPVEHWRWKVGKVFRTHGQKIENEQEIPDLRRMQAHTPPAFKKTL